MMQNFHLNENDAKWYKRIKIIDDKIEYRIIDDKNDN